MHETLRILSMLRKEVDKSFRILLKIDDILHKTLRILHEILRIVQQTLQK